MSIEHDKRGLDLDQVRAWQADGLSLAQIAARLGKGPSYAAHLSRALGRGKKAKRAAAAAAARDVSVSLSGVLAQLQEEQERSGRWLAVVDQLQGWLEGGADSGEAMAALGRLQVLAGKGGSTGRLVLDIRNQHLRVIEACAGVLRGLVDAQMVQRIVAAMVDIIEQAVPEAERPRVWARLGDLGALIQAMRAAPGADLLQLQLPGVAVQGSLGYAGQTVSGGANGFPGHGAAGVGPAGEGCSQNDSSADGRPALLPELLPPGWPVGGGGVDDGAAGAGGGAA